LWLVLEEERCDGHSNRNKKCLQRTDAFDEILHPRPGPAPRSSPWQHCSRNDLIKRKATALRVLVQVVLGPGDVISGASHPGLNDALKRNWKMVQEFSGKPTYYTGLHWSY